MNLDNNQERSQTISEFCDAEKISKSSYHKLKGRGLAPEELEIPGTKIKRITPSARQAWRERMAQLAQGEAVQLEAERRRAQAAEAGRIAAQSPRHVSRRQLQPKRRRRG